MPTSIIALLEEMHSDFLFCLSPMIINSDLSPSTIIYFETQPIREAGKMPFPLSPNFIFCNIYLALPGFSCHMQNLRSLLQHAGELLGVVHGI